MHDVFYTKSEGGKIIHSMINLSQEEQKKQCEAQALDIVNSYHKVVLLDDNIVIEASAVFFLDGYIWDAILSGYDSMRKEKYNVKKEKWKMRKLPNCQKLPYWGNL